MNMEFDNNASMPDKYERKSYPSSGGGNYSSNQNSNYSRNNYNNSSNNSNNDGGNNYRKNYSKSNYFKKKEEFNGEAKLYKPYVGSGNRDAPSDVSETIQRLAKFLEEFGFICRTGGMEGPEQNFEDAAKNHELHLPWKGFNNKESKSAFNTPEALAIAKMFHPTFDDLKPAIQAFLAKNARLVLGKDLRSPALFVLCWSADGAECSREKTARTGNVGHVIAIASAIKIPIFNLAKPDAEYRLKQHLELNANEQVKNLTEI